MTRLASMVAASLVVLAGCGATTHDQAAPPASQAAAHPAAAQCQPRVCGPLLCGHGDDGCGEHLDCGGCPNGRNGRILVGQGVNLYVEARRRADRQIHCPGLEPPEAPRYAARLTVAAPDGTQTEHDLVFVGRVVQRAGRNSAGHCVVNEPAGAHVDLPPFTAPGHHRLELSSPEQEASLPYRQIIVVEELVP